MNWEEQPSASCGDSVLLKFYHLYNYPPNSKVFSGFSHLYHQVTMIAQTSECFTFIALFSEEKNLQMLRTNLGVNKILSKVRGESHCWWVSNCFAPNKLILWLHVPQIADCQVHKCLTFESHSIGDEMRKNGENDLKILKISDWWN